MQTILGCYDKNLEIITEETREERFVQVRRENSKFRIVLGPLALMKQPMEGFYALEIHYKDSENHHTSKLTLGGFGSMIFYDYAEKAHELAEKFCEEKCLTLEKHINSWPVFQAVVRKEEVYICN